MRPKYFMIAVGMLLAGMFSVHRPLPNGDLFASIPRGHSVKFDRLTNPEMFAAKLVHARLNKRYEIGVFGNSRNLMVAGRDVGSGYDRSQ